LMLTHEHSDSAFFRARLMFRPVLALALVNSRQRLCVILFPLRDDDEMINF
jgi:hypothetical protein